jgi:hypothetical protein
MDGKATKIYHSLKGTRFYISPIVLWEIFLTTKEKRREVLIHYLQHLAHDKLLNSPSEFIINYINAGCPLVEKHYDYHSRLPIGETWSDISFNTKKTFIFDNQVIGDYSKMIRSIFKYANKLTEEVGLITNDNIHHKKDLLWLENIFSQIKNADTKKIDSKTKSFIK